LPSPADAHACKYCVCAFAKATTIPGTCTRPLLVFMQLKLYFEV